jgi:ketosteroid isomerase-like protein
MPAPLSGVVADHIAAVNAHDADAITATFAPDAYVSAQHGQYVGTDAVRRFIEREIIADNVTVECAKSTTTETRSSARFMTATTTRPTCPKR